MRGVLACPFLLLPADCRLLVPLLNTIEGVGDRGPSSTTQSLRSIREVDLANELPLGPEGEEEDDVGGDGLLAGAAGCKDTAAIGDNGSSRKSMVSFGIRPSFVESDSKADFLACTEEVAIKVQV